MITELPYHIYALLLTLVYFVVTPMTLSQLYSKVRKQYKKTKRQMRRKYRHMRKFGVFAG